MTYEDFIKFIDEPNKRVSAFGSKYYKNGEWNTQHIMLYNVVKENNHVGVVIRISSDGYYILKNTNDFNISFIADFNGTVLAECPKLLDRGKYLKLGWITNFDIEKIKEINDFLKKLINLKNI